MWREVHHMFKFAFLCFSVDLLFFNTLINVMASLDRKGTSFPVEQQQQQQKKLA